VGVIRGIKWVTILEGVIPNTIGNGIGMHHRPVEIVGASIRGIAVGPPIHANRIEGILEDGVVESDGQSIFSDVCRGVVVVVEVEIGEVVIHLRQIGVFFVPHDHSKIQVIVIVLHVKGDVMRLGAVR
jgi:hypothetical protein